MLIGLAQKAQHLKFLVGDNSPLILTSMGVVGTVGTAYLTGRASFKAARILDQENTEFPVEVDLEYEDEEGDLVKDEILKTNLSTVGKVKLVWKLYIPPVAAGATTIACIVAANKISSKKIAALALAGGISERAFQEYKDKVIEKLGDRQDTKIRDEIAQDRVNKNTTSQQVVLAGDGEVLCFDLTSGRYFKSTVEDIKRAENKVNWELIHYGYSNLTTFYDELGLAPTTHSDSVGWNLHNKMEVKFSTVMSPDNRPCVAVDFTKQPISEYNKTEWN
jgi:hypothetical protein